MTPDRFRLATFNLFNLVAPEVPYYGHLEYSAHDFDEKLAWAGGQLDSMNADLVAVQEVFHEQALKTLAARQGSYPAEGVLAPGADGAGPAVGLISRLPVLAHESIADFPESALLDLEGQPLNRCSFSRPVLRATVQLPGGAPCTVFVVHLKSQRPEVPEGEDPHDLRQRALGKARSLMIRAAEAVALRHLVIDALQGKEQACVVLGDANDAGDAVTTEIVTGTPPWRSLPKEAKLGIWDALLYDVWDVQTRPSDKRVAYTHIHNATYECLDHIFVSQEFVRASPKHLATVEYVTVLNDHLVDQTHRPRAIKPWRSDHGQVVAQLRLRPPRRPR